MQLVLNTWISYLRIIQTPNISMDGNSKISIYVCIRMGCYSFVIVTQLECLDIDEISAHQSCYLVSCPDSLSRFFFERGSWAQDYSLAYTKTLYGEILDM